MAGGIGALFVGGSGLGKTHLARALGYAQCQRGHRVLFTTLPALVNRLSAAEATKTLHQALKGSHSPAVLLVDEIGYVTLRQPESHLLFQVLSVRHDRHQPTLITPNRVFAEWNQIFADDAVAHAILDRLAERAEVFHLEGTSYRETHPPPPRAEGHAGVGGARLTAASPTVLRALRFPGVPAPVCPGPPCDHVKRGAGHGVLGGNWPLRDRRSQAGAYSPHVAPHPTIFAGDFPCKSCIWCSVSAHDTHSAPQSRPRQRRERGATARASGRHAGRAVNESKELAQWPDPWHPHWAAWARLPATTQTRTARGAHPLVHPSVHPLAQGGAQ